MTGPWFDPNGAEPIDDSSPFTGLVIAALLSLPLWIIVVGLIVLRVKS